MYIKIQLIDDSDGCDDIESECLSNSEPEDKAVERYLELINLIQHKWEIKNESE